MDCAYIYRCGCTCWVTLTVSSRETLQLPPHGLCLHVRVWMHILGDPRSDQLRDARKTILSPYGLCLYLSMYECGCTHILGDPRSVQLRKATTPILSPYGLHITALPLYSRYWRQALLMCYIVCGLCLYLYLYGCGCTHILGDP